MRKENIYRTVVVCFTILLLYLSPGFTLVSKAEDPKQNLQIYVVNYPLQYFAERIGGDYADVFFPAPTDIDPAFWSPGRGVVRQYQKADLILLNGADYAKWIDKVTLPKSKLINTSKSFKAEYIPLEVTATHSHGPTGEHAHTGVAFTTWLDPLLAIKQADSIKEALIKLMPHQKDLFVRNYESLKNDLEDLDRKIEKIVSVDPTMLLLSSHPVYQYFARRYDLNMASVHWEPNEIPGPDQLQELNIILENHPAKWMIWEDAPMKETDEKLKSLGIRSIVFNPCGNLPENVDYLSVMTHNVENLKTVFQSN